MAKTNRNQPMNAKSSDATTTVFDFQERFPDDAACLEALVGMLYPEGIFCPKCQKVTKHHRITSRPAYSCQFCGHHEYPMKGTIFENSSTSLKAWFYAMFLMASTRCGISAKQLEREIGVTYPTAHRMAKKIRSLLDEDGEEDWPLEGTVEVDELHWGGKDKWKHQSAKKRLPSYGKTPVLGMAQRKTKTQPGRVVAKVLAGRTEDSILPHVRTKVLPKSSVYTDEGLNLQNIGAQGYRQARVNHDQGVYVDGDVHSNTIEGFWSLLRRGIGGVYHSVSTTYLQSYLDEYTFRYNHREDRGGMFDAFLGRIEKTPD